jgi:hypothetical protein
MDAPSQFELKIWNRVTLFFRSVSNLLNFSKKMKKWANSSDLNFAYINQIGEFF